MDKSKKILLIVIGVVICIFCGVKACAKVAGHLSLDETISTISEAVASDPNMNYDDAERYTPASEGSMDARMVRELQIKWINGDITVEYGDQDQITWKETYKQGEPNEVNCLYYYLDEDELNLAFCAAGTKGLKGQSRKLKKDLVVTLPQACRLKEIDIDNFNGSITTSVDAQKISTECVNGDKHITAKNVNEVDLDGVNGSSYLYLPANTAFKVEFDKVNGALSSDFQTVKTGNIYTSGAAPYMDIEMDVVNGSLYIKQL